MSSFSQWQKVLDAMPASSFLKRILIVAMMLVVPGAALVEAALSISTDHRQLSFGLMRLGEEKTLAEFGSYHHQITCSSTNGQAWYVKIHLLQPLSSGAEMIPLDHFKWEATTTNGKGTLAHPNQFTPFNTVPDLVYLSGPKEASGTTVTFQFRYLLQIPQEQVNGVYSATVRFTLTELL